MKRNCRLADTGGATERPAICEAIPARPAVIAYHRNSFTQSRRASRHDPQGPALTILQISDTHLHAAADSRMRGVTTYATFLAVLEHAQRDRAGPSTRSSPPATSCRTRVAPVTNAFARHSSRSVFRSTRFRQPRRPEAHGRDPRERLVPARRRAAPRLLVRRAAQHVPRRRGCRRPGPARLQGLRQALAAHSSQHVLVAMHHHPLPMGSAWLDGVALRDATAFWSIIDTHPGVRGVVCGHVHQAATRRATACGS